MKVLGIDTSGYANAVAVVDGNRVLAERIFETKTDSLGQIVTNIDSILKKARLSLKNIDGFGIGLGPGSWTGIRISVTVGKTLAYSTGKPIAGITTLEALACGNIDAAAQVCPIISIGTRDMVYAALYRRQDKNVTRVSDYYVGDIHALAGIIKEPTIFVSADWQTYRDILIQALRPLDMAVDMVKEAKANANQPKGSSKHPQVQTGTLRRAITLDVKRSRNKIVALVGIMKGKEQGDKALVYARRIEFGFMGSDSLGRHFAQPPYPFLYPAVKAVARRAKDYFR